MCGFIHWTLETVPFKVIAFPVSNSPTTEWCANAADATKSMRTAKRQFNRCSIRTSSFVPVIGPTGRIIFLLTLFRQCFGDGQSRPTGSRRRDPLMAAERKTTFEVPLLRIRVSLHEPGTVRILGSEQESHALAVNLIGRRHAGNMQSVQVHSGCIGIRWRPPEL